MALSPTPLCSENALGTIGDQLTIQTWKGRPYFRKKPTPRQPNTHKQHFTRAIFRFCSINYHALNTNQQADWIDASKPKNITPLNAWIQDSQRLRKRFNAIRASKHEPATGGGPIIYNSTFTPSARGILIDYTTTSPLFNGYTWMLGDDATIQPSGTVGRLLWIDKFDEGHVFIPLPPGLYNFRSYVAPKRGDDIRLVGFNPTTIP